ncbi:epsilon-lactone hydrolase [Burkholderiales bacterium]|nr:epsilon-lactone hydrolase [Burkholderiales bacterium]
MPLDPGVADYLARVAAEIAPLAEPTPAARRNRMELIARRFPAPEDAVARGDAWIAMPGREIAVRLYRPRAGRLPGIVYLHGGGWVAGSLATHDGACAALAQDADAVVASVHYRRAPENPYPAPNDDAYAALAWLAGHADALDVDASRIGVGGDSAGAHLAIGCAIEARDRGGPRVALLLLVYPVVEPAFDTASYREHASSPTLTRDDMIGYWRDYLPPGADDGGARAVPTRDTLAGLPPVHVVVAGLDPLRDEGVALASRLAQAGVAATLAEAASLPHGFLRAAPYAAAARKAQAALGSAARAALRR